jgi:cardiolipin synthase
MPLVGVRMSWPNRISLLRLVLVTPFVVLLLDARLGWQYRYGAMALAVVIGAGDALDGYLARRLGQVTRIGSILDPLADYALRASAIVILGMPGVLSDDPALRLPVWVSVTLVSRDVFMLVGTVVLYLLVGFFQGLPSVTGKAVTVLEFVLIGAMLVAPDAVPLAPVPLMIALKVLWGVTVAVGVISWIGYLRTGSKLLSAGESKA